MKAILVKPDIWSKYVFTDQWYDHVSAITIDIPYTKILESFFTMKFKMEIKITEPFKNQDQDDYIFVFENEDDLLLFQLNV